MLKRSLAIALVIVVGAMAESPIAAAPGDFLIVRGDVVNVRAGPSTGYRVRMRVLLEQLVIERRREGDWIEVRIAGNGGEGWIHGSLLTKIRPTMDGGPRPAEPLMPAKVEIAETTAPIGRPVGGPLEAWAEPDLGGGSAAIDLPSVAIASAQNLVESFCQKIAHGPT